MDATTALGLALFGSVVVANSRNNARRATAVVETLAVGPTHPPIAVDPKEPKDADYLAAEIYGWSKLCAEQGYLYDPNHPNRCQHTRQSCEQGPGQSTSDVYGDYAEWHNGRCIAVHTEMRNRCRGDGLTVISDPSGVHRCKTNKRYCDRKGLEWDGNDCHLPTGQMVVETVFGTTITRGVKKFFEDEVACLFGAFC